MILKKTYGDLDILFVVQVLDSLYLVQLEHLFQGLANDSFPKGLHHFLEDQVWNPWILQL